MLVEDMTVRNLAPTTQAYQAAPRGNASRGRSFMAEYEIRSAGSIVTLLSARREYHGDATWPEDGIVCEQSGFSRAPAGFQTDM